MAEVKRNQQKIGKMKTLIFLVFLSFSATINAQEPSMSILTSLDTILMDNTFQVKIKIENVKGQYEAPDFKGFDIVGGPNMSSSMSVINGDVKQSIAYTYFLRPQRPGTFWIKEAYMTSEDVTLETPPHQIIVLDNPMGIQQEGRMIDDGNLMNGFDSFDFFQPDPKVQPKRKSKVKRYKI